MKAGEIGGILDGVLLRVADQLERDQDLRRKVRSAMTYPIVVLVLAILAASFMLIFIVPVFAKCSRTWGTLPLPTRICMAISDILTSIFGVLVYVGWRSPLSCSCDGRSREWQEGVGTGRAQDTGQDRRRRPKVALARFARTLATLSAAGVPILQAIEITATSSGNWVVEKALLKSRDAIREGIPIYKPWRQSPSSRRW